MLFVGGEALDFVSVPPDGHPESLGHLWGHAALSAAVSPPVVGRTCVWASQGLELDPGRPQALGRK